MSNNVVLINVDKQLGLGTSVSWVTVIAHWMSQTILCVKSESETFNLFRPRNGKKHQIKTFLRLNFKWFHDFTIKWVTWQCPKWSKTQLRPTSAVKIPTPAATTNLELLVSPNRSRSITCSVQDVISIRSLSGLIRFSRFQIKYCKLASHKWSNLCALFSDKVQAPLPGCSWRQGSLTCFIGQIFVRCRS